MQVGVEALSQNGFKSAHFPCESPVTGASREAGLCAGGPAGCGRAASWQAPAARPPRESGEARLGTTLCNRILGARPRSTEARDRRRARRRGSSRSSGRALGRSGGRPWLRRPAAVGSDEVLELLRATRAGSCLGALRRLAPAAWATARAPFQRLRSERLRSLSPLPPLPPFPPLPLAFSFPFFLSLLWLICGHADFGCLPLQCSQRWRRW